MDGTNRPGRLLVDVDLFLDVGGKGYVRTYGKFLRNLCTSDDSFHFGYCNMSASS
jgi:hypothetical protein